MSARRRRSRTRTARRRLPQRYISRVQALLDSVHIDINNEGVNEEDIGMEVQMDEEEAAMKAADEMIEGFWRD